MRTIETNLYTFEELTEEAQENAIKNLKERAFDIQSEWDWDDANQSIKEVENIARISCDIQQSSQGFYVRFARELMPDYDINDIETWNAFLKRINKWQGGVWSDFDLKDKILEWQYDDYQSYANNVAEAIITFCKKVYLNTLDYFDEDNVKEFIINNNYEFTEDGTPYNH